MKSTMPSMKHELSKKYGASIFYCKFDPIHDFVIDTMHVVLNLLLTQLELKVTTSWAW